jgi:hypothetical protein
MTEQQVKGAGEQPKKKEKKGIEKFGREDGRKKRKKAFVALFSHSLISNKWKKMLKKNPRKKFTYF